ncbi:hypothetical protein [Spongiactinospora sp. 9N601]|uniref:hypothetical protein n=1 Tax=Spongiactinospora sp. 9N601 TaxID=3375149 RepID=UPI0037974B7E
MPRTTSRYGRVVTVTTATVSAPAAVWLVHPALSIIIAGLLIALGIVIMASALFGSERLSERAFRLLRWIANRPEPPSASPG